MGDYTAIWRVRVLAVSVSGLDTSKGARGTSCHATSALSLFWIVVTEEALKRPSDWSLLRIVVHAFVLCPRGWAHGSVSAAKRTSDSRSSAENL